MREHMRKVRARQKLERERDEAVNAAMARLSSMDAPSTADLSVNDRLVRSEANMADMLLVLEEMKRRVVEVGENGPKPAQR